MHLIASFWNKHQWNNGCAVWDWTKACCDYSMEQFNFLEHCSGSGHRLEAHFGAHCIYPTPDNTTWFVFKGNHTNLLAKKAFNSDPESQK